jgi:hypothetical protein
MFNMGTMLSYECSRCHHGMDPQVVTIEEPYAICRRCKEHPCWLCGVDGRKPGPQATNWAEDYRLSRHWLKECLKVWDAIPVEFRGDRAALNRETGEVLTLVEKVQAMGREIERLRAWGNEMAERLHSIEQEGMELRDRG